MPENIGRFALALVSVLLAGCGEERTVDGGGATETDNAIRIVATSDAGAPVVGARVVFVRTDTWLRDLDSRGAPRTFEKVTDSRGFVLLDSLPEGQWSAQTTSRDVGGILPLRRDSAWQSLTLAPLADLVLTTPDAPARRMHAVGTDWSAVSDSRGRALLRLPAGRRALVAELDSILAPVATLTLETGRSLDTTVRLKARRVLLDDFTSGDGTPSLRQYNGVGWWSVDPWGTTLVSPPSFGGRLSVRYAPSGASNTILAGFLFRDRARLHSLDLSSMDSVCLSVRGNDAVDLFFIHYNPDGTWGLSANAPLRGIDTTTFRRICLVPDSLQDRWPEVRTQVSAIGFMARGGGLLELSTLELWGVRMIDLTP